MSGRQMELPLTVHQRREWLVAQMAAKFAKEGPRRLFVAIWQEIDRATEGRGTVAILSGQALASRARYSRRHIRRIRPALEMFGLVGCRECTDGGGSDAVEYWIDFEAIERMISDPLSPPSVKPSLPRAADRATSENLNGRQVGHFVRGGRTFCPGGVGHFHQIPPPYTSSPPKDKYPPPPPESLSALGRSADALPLAEDGGRWGRIEILLLEAGVIDPEPAIAACRRRGVDPAEVVAIVEHWRAHRGQWGPGALRRRLMSHFPGANPAERWVEPKRERYGVSRPPERSRDQHRAAAARELDGLSDDEFAAVARRALGKGVEAMIDGERVAAVRSRIIEMAVDRVTKRPENGQRTNDN